MDTLYTNVFCREYTTLNRNGKALMFWILLLQWAGTTKNDNNNNTVTLLKISCTRWQIQVTSVCSLCSGYRLVWFTAVCCEFLLSDWHPFTQDWDSVLLRNGRLKSFAVLMAHTSGVQKKQTVGCYIGFFSPLSFKYRWCDVGFLMRVLKFQNLLAPLSVF